MTIQRWKPESLKQKRLSNEEVEKIQELKEQGKTQREIAEEIGVAQQAIDYQLTKKENFPILSKPPVPEEDSSNIIPSPVQFQKQESDDYPMLGFDRFLRGSFPHLSNLDR